MRQSSNCVFVQELNITFKETSIVISVIALINSTSTKFVSSNCIAFSSQIFYLIIKDLYHKQKTLFVKSEKLEAVKNAIVASKTFVSISTSSSLFIQSKFQFVASSELQTEFNSFKFEEFTISFNSSSTSTKSSFEFVIQSDVILVASSIFTSASKNSKVISSRLISLCSTSTISLINQSSYLLVANQLVAHFLYQHTMILCFESIIKSDVVLVTNSTFFFNYDKRLTTFKKWLHTSFTSKTLIQAEFRHTSTKLSLNCITCRRCDVILLDWKFHDDFIKEHLRRNSECFRAKTIKQVVIETIKSEIINFKNIDFFDFIMQVNLWKKFSISINIASFLHHLIETIVKYQEKSITKFFSQCPRDSALQWLKNQFKFISLNDFKTIIAKIFSISEINLDQTIIDFSSQKYHRCFECDAQFSLTSRLLTHTQKNCFKSFTCKHCEKIFALNNKFHEHVRLHKKMSDKTLRQRFVERRDNHINSSNSRSTFSITFKLMTISTKSLYLIISMTKAQVVCFITSSINSFITSKISREAITTNSKSITKLSRFSRFTLITLLILSTTFKSMFVSTKSSFLIISMTKTFVACFFTSSTSSFRTSILSHTISKIYMIMKNLFEMFVEKSSKRNMNIIQKKSIFSRFFEFRQFRQTRIKSIDSQENLRDLTMFAEKQFRRNLNAIRKKMRFSLFSMFDQIQIINYFKFVDQSNSTSIKSIKFNTFINCFNSTSRICFSVNQIAKTSQHQHIAIDETSNSKIKQKFKFDVFINNFNSTSRVCSSINQDARISHIASETNFTSLITSTKTSSLKIQKIKIRVSIDSLESRYLVAANVDHINKDIRVETSLTNAKRYNSIKSSIKSIEKLKFKSIKSIEKLKFNNFNSKLNSTSRVRFSINQIAETWQYQHIAIKSTEKFKSIKFSTFISCFNSTSRFCFSINHDSLISSRIDFLRVLINQMIYVSINSRFRRFRQRYIAVAVVFICI